MHVLVLTQNNIAPARYGGALRVAALAHHLRSEGHRVSVIRFVSPGEAPSEECDLQVRDISAPRGYPMAPIAAAYHLLDRVAIRHALELDAEEKVSLVQSDVPWASLTGYRVARHLGVPHVLLSMNCETLLARQFSQDGPARKLPLVGGLLADANVSVVGWAEGRSIRRASLTLTPSEADIVEMRSVGIVPSRVMVLPNGTGIRPMPGERGKIRAELGLGQNEPTVIFVGRMDYPPNRDAIEAICSLIAPALPQVRFLLVGSNPPQIETPPNVIMVGQVDMVDPYLAAADIAIVPLLRGSGTRIKILDAWAAGLPIISTSVGASGLTYTEGDDILVEDDLAAFPGRIDELLNTPSLMERLREGARAAALPYTWEAIGERYVTALQTLADDGRRNPQSTIRNPQSEEAVA